jgi:hypothetical protein
MMSMVAHSIITISLRLVIGQAINYNASSSLAMCLQMEAEMTSGPMFSQLQLDLIEYVWNTHHT